VPGRHRAQSVIRARLGRVGLCGAGWPVDGSVQRRRGLAHVGDDRLRAAPAGERGGQPRPTDALLRRWMRIVSPGMSFMTLTNRLAGRGVGPVRQRAASVIVRRFGLRDSATSRKLRTNRALAARSLTPSAIFPADVRNPNTYWLGGGRRRKGDRTGRRRGRRGGNPRQRRAEQSRGVGDVGGVHRSPRVYLDGTPPDPAAATGVAGERPTTAQAGHRPEMDHGSILRPARCPGSFLGEGRGHGSGSFRFAFQFDAPLRSVSRVSASRVAIRRCRSSFGKGPGRR